MTSSPLDAEQVETVAVVKGASVPLDAEQAETVAVTRSVEILPWINVSRF